jgi:hypothetical protein
MHEPNVSLQSLPRCRPTWSRDFQGGIVPDVSDMLPHLSSPHRASQNTNQTDWYMNSIRFSPLRPSNTSLCLSKLLPHLRLVVLFELLSAKLHLRCNCLLGFNGAYTQYPALFSLLTRGIRYVMLSTSVSFVRYLRSMRLPTRSYLTYYINVLSWMHASRPQS